MTLSNKKLAGTLIYVHDPMCSWCWAFAPVWQEIQERLSGLFVIKYVVGGLAPDTSEPMPKTLQEKLQSIWRQIQTQVPGTQFNFAFWDECVPRRSTYAACRAVLTTKLMQPEKEQAMIKAIQQGYYLQARNPSNDETLLKFADELGLDADTFASHLNGPLIAQTLKENIELASHLPINGFPSLVLQKENEHIPIQINYNDAEIVLSQLHDN